MSKLLGVIAIVLLVSALPETAAAQCGSDCAILRKANGEPAGHGCVTEDNNLACIATTTRCTLSMCWNALLTTPEGRVVGELACGDTAVEPARMAWAPFGMAARLFLAAREAQVALATREGATIGTV